MANHYVRAGATGSADGTNWTDAWTALPATLTRGDTYYVADGDYDGYAFNDAESGTLYITIKKATVADHGTATGWDNGYGDGVATWSATPAAAQLFFTTGYWVFDGQVGGGPGSWNSGHGFKVSGNLGTAQKLIRLGGYSSVQQPTHIEIRHVELAHQGETNRADDILYSWAGVGLGIEDCTISHCYFHHSGRDMALIMYTERVVFEYNLFKRNYSNPTQHATGLEDFGSNYLTFRYNRMCDIEGTAYLDLKKNYDDPHTDWDIYGNCFYVTPGNPDGVTEVGNGVVAATSPTGENGTTNNIKIYNNTLANVVGLKTGFYFPAGTGNEAYNNLWWNCDQVAHLNVTHDYNHYANTDFAWGTEASAHDTVTESDPFENSATDDFTLAGATAAGTEDLTEPDIPGTSTYSVDLAGATRGADGVWDRGAFEFQDSWDVRKLGGRRGRQTMYKNTASQKVAIYAYNSTTGAPVTGDAANITGLISKDGAVAAATNDVNPAPGPTTAQAGVYYFDLAQAETNADLVVLSAVSATSGVRIDPVIARTVTAATATALATAQADLDILTGSNGATLAASQPNYAPATATALATAQTDLDTITGSDGVTLATAQGNYAPAKAGNQMDLVNAPNATAQAALKVGLGLVKVQAAVYDSASVSGNTITLSNGATQTKATAGRVTAGG